MIMLEQLIYSKLAELGLIKKMVISVYICKYGIADGLILMEMAEK